MPLSHQHRGADAVVWAAELSVCGHTQSCCMHNCISNEAHDGLTTPWCMQHAAILCGTRFEVKLTAATGCRTGQKPRNEPQGGGLCPAGPTSQPASRSVITHQPHLFLAACLLQPASSYNVFSHAWFWTMFLYRALQVQRHGWFHEHHPDQDDVLVQSPAGQCRRCSGRELPLKGPGTGYRACPAPRGEGLVVQPPESKSADTRDLTSEM